MLALAALVLALPIFALAGQSHHAPLRRHAWKSRTMPVPRRASNSSYTLEDDYSGKNFFNGFTFFTQGDPTHGQVDYVSQADAQKDNLINVGGDGTVTIAVDSTTQLAPGQPRKSVRITSKKSYNSGLFIADFKAMPTGCGTWPAYWTVGPNWPSGGEIDIVEGVNTNTNNQVTLHTSATCTISNAAAGMTGNLGHPECTSSNGDNSGCGVGTDGGNSFGAPFNGQGGGVFAHTWDAQGIRVWFFPRGQVPADITSGSPNPAAWGKPVAFFPNNDSCDTAEHFHDHNIVINTTLCGDWAGAAFSGAGCPGTCSDYVANPDNFKDAKWEINSIKVYKSA